MEQGAGGRGPGTRGAAAVVAVLVSLVLMTLALVASELVATDAVVAVGSADHLQAFYSAQAGIARAREEFRINPLILSNTWGGNLGVTSSTWAGSLTILGTAFDGNHQVLSDARVSGSGTISRDGGSTLARTFVRETGWPGVTTAQDIRRDILAYHQIVGDPSASVCNNAGVGTWVEDGANPPVRAIDFEPTTHFGMLKEPAAGKVTALVIDFGRAVTFDQFVINHGDTVGGRQDLGMSCFYIWDPFTVTGAVGSYLPVSGWNGRSADGFTPGRFYGGGAPGVVTVTILGGPVSTEKCRVMVVNADDAEVWINEIEFRLAGQDVRKYNVLREAGGFVVE